MCRIHRKNMVGRNIKTLLRYPGGKQRLAPFVASLIAENGLEGCDYVEPYAGGAGVAMELLFSGKVARVHLNDKCPQLLMFWESLRDDPERFAHRIDSAVLNVDEWKKMRTIIQRFENYSREDVGFAFFYLNRTNFSGVISGGVIGGLEQKGNYKMDARFYRERLAKLARSYASFSDRILLYHEDAINFIQRIPLMSQGKCFVYCDPPYYHKGQQLYLNSYGHNDHANVAQVIKEVLSNEHWIVSYDTEEAIRDLYAGFRQFIFNLQYSARTKVMGKEVFILGNKVKMPATPCLELVPVV